MYRENVESVRVAKNCPDEYRKRVEYVGVSKNDRIRVSIKKLFQRVPEKGQICGSTEKW